jgi:hypothetical protein
MKLKVARYSFWLSSALYIMSAFSSQFVVISFLVVSTSFFLTTKLTVDDLCTNFPFITLDHKNELGFNEFAVLAQVIVFSAANLLFTVAFAISGKPLGWKYSIVTIVLNAAGLVVASSMRYRYLKRHR